MIKIKEFISLYKKNYENGRQFWKNGPFTSSLKPPYFRWPYLFSSIFFQTVFSSVLSLKRRFFSKNKYVTKLSDEKQNAVAGRYKISPHMTTGGYTTMTK